MRVVTILAICVVSLSLVVDAAPSKKELFEEGIKNLLVPYCDKDATCETLVLFSSLLCATPSEAAICQSDCKFVLSYLWEKYFTNRKPEVGQLRQFVPDHCAPSGNRKNLKGSTGSIPTKPNYDDDDDNEEEDEKFSAVSSYEGDEHNLLHLTFNFDHDEEIHEAVAELKSVAHYDSSVSCVASDSSSLKPGQIHQRPCEEKFPYQTGNILGLCLDSGYVYYTNIKCDVNFDKFDKAAQQYRTEMNALLREGDVDPKVVFDKGAQLLGFVSSFMGSDKIKDFLPICEKLAGVLGPLGIAFQFVSFFLPASDPKHDAIMASFKKLEDKTTEIKDAIERLPNIFKKELFDARIEQMVTNLAYLEGDIELFSNQNTEAFRNKVEKSCANFPGDKFVNDITQIFIAKSPDYIAQLYGYDKKQYRDTLAKILLVYSVRASQAALKCLGLDKATTAADSEFYATKLEQRVKVMYGKINYIEEEFIPNNAMANWIDPDVTEFVTKHKGEDNQKLVNSLFDYLSKKYTFYKFSVAVYDKDSSTTVAARSYKCFKCVGLQFSGMHFTDKQYDKAIQIMYTNTFAPDIKDKIEQIFKYAVREDLQYYVDYLSKGSIRNVLACRFGQNLRTNSASGYGRFYNIQSVSTLFTY